MDVHPKSNSRRMALAAIVGGLGVGVTADPRQSLAQFDVYDHDSGIRNIRRDYGAVGDGVADDTSAMQRAVDDVAKGNGGIIFLPPGRYRITREIAFPEASGGGLFIGSGCYVGDPRSRRRKSTHSIIIWDGSAGGTIFSARGNLGWKIAHMTFVGRLNSDGARAACAYHCQYMPTAGSGVGIFELCHFVDFDFAIKMGDGPKDYGCADYVFTMCGFSHCDICIWVVNNQGVNYNFFYVTANWCGTFIRSERSAHVFIYNGQFAGCGRPGSWVLDFAQLDDNNSVVLINGLRAEQKTTHLLRAVGKGAVTIVGYEECQAAQDADMFFIDGPSVSLSGSRLVRETGKKKHFRIRSDKNRRGASLKFDRVYFDSENFDLDEWIEIENDASIQIQSCSSGPDQAAIVNVNTSLTWGDVSLYGRSLASKRVILAYPYQKSGTARINLPGGQLNIISVSISGVAEESGQLVSLPEMIIRADDKGPLAQPNVGLPEGITASVDFHQNSRSFAVSVGSASEAIVWQAVCKLRPLFI